MIAEKHILLAEDEDSDALLMLRAFRKANIKAPLFRVKDGEEVVSYLMGHGVYANREEYPLPSLLLLDLKMPKKNGFEVLEWLKSQPKLKRLPVTVLTSSDQFEDIQHAYDAGANSYLQKPSEFNDLIEVISSLQSYWARVQRPSF